MDECGGVQQTGEEWVLDGSGYLPGHFLLRVGAHGAKIFLGIGSTGRFYLSLLCGLLHRH